jgi:hypothetical protein
VFCPHFHVHPLGENQNLLNLFQTKPNVKVFLKSFSDEAYGFITCGAEPPHKVKVNINIKTIHTADFDFDVDFVWRL